jgi:hypothetical protein
MAGALGAALIAGTVMTVVPPVPSAGASGYRYPTGGPVVGTALDQGTSPALRVMPRDQAQPQRPPREGLAHRAGSLAPKATVVADPLRQSAAATIAAPAVASFEGTNNVDGVVPPDTDGAVGPDDYVELVNQHYQVFNKTGASLAGPIESAQMWSAFSSSSSAAKLCTTNPGGDGIVLYDRAADRWLFSELAFTNGLFGPTGPFVECFAVSKSGDPTGAYFVYAFLMSNNELPDYPKIGIWGNGYYLSANMFTSVFATSSNPEVWAFDRNAMISGPPATVQYVTFAGAVPSTYNTILPADVDGPTQPPAGSPEIFAGLDFANDTTLGLWQFSQVDWTQPGTATFSSSPTIVNVAPYNTLCGGSQDCLSQPGTSQKLDAISDRVMYRLAYRNFGDHEALVVNHSVNVALSATQAGVRWYEIDRALPGGSYVLAQQGTYAPDNTTSRWMGSVAMDGAGDIALGYSSASAAKYPSVNFTGRLRGDPAGQMTVAEGTIQTGGGSQTGYNRWGDYTRMAIDPADDCTFWYVGEYYSASAPDQWHTRIGSFRLSSCATTPDFSIGANPTSLSLADGNSGVSTISTAVKAGSAATVNLSVGGAPAGATASLSPNSVTAGGSSTLTVDAGTSAPGSYILTVTGTEGTATHSTTLALTVLSPFAMVSPASGPPGTAVTVSGGNFDGGDTVKVTYNTGLASPASVVLCTATALADGTFTCSGQIPAKPTAGAKGAHKIVAKAQPSLSKAKATFTRT